MRDWVDAAVVTDGQGAQVRMAAWAGCLAIKAEGVDPVMLVQCRDRNRIAIQSDLLGAAAAGIANVLLQTGDPASAGDEPAATEVFDLDSLSAISAASTMKTEKRLSGGRKLAASPRWFIGAVENASQAGDERVKRLARKVAAGAQFVLTQYVFDVGRLRDFMRRLRDEGLDKRCYVLPGVGPILSPGALSYIERLPDVYLPAAVRGRLLGVPEGRMEAEGLALAVETLQAVREVPGVAGAYLLASQHEGVIPELMAAAGLGKREGQRPWR